MDFKIVAMLTAFPVLVCAALLYNQKVTTPPPTPVNAQYFSVQLISRSDQSNISELWHIDQSYAGCSGSIANGSATLFSGISFNRDYKSGESIQDFLKKADKVRDLKQYQVLLIGNPVPQNIQGQDKSKEEEKNCIIIPGTWITSGKILR